MYSLHRYLHSVQDMLSPGDKVLRDMQYFSLEKLFWLWVLGREQTRGWNGVKDEWSSQGRPVLGVTSDLSAPAEVAAPGTQAPRWERLSEEQEDQWLWCRGREEGLRLAWGTGQFLLHSDSILGVMGSYSRFLSRGLTVSDSCIKKRIAVA